MENNETNIWGDDTAPVETLVAEAPVVETPVIETPVINEEVPVIETPAVETPAIETPVINEIVPTEKIVEKIVEKYPEFDSPEGKALFEAFQKGDEDSIYNYLSEKKRDYNTMSDYDVVKAGLKRDNPDWNDKRIDLEFKAKYDTQAKKELPNEDTDPEGHDRALAYNEAIDQRQALLEMQAEDYRIKLNGSKKDIQLPKIQETAAPEVTVPTEAEIAAQSKVWEDAVAAAMPTVSNIPLTVNGEEVVYKVTEEDRTGLTAAMKDFNAMDFLTKERKWLNEDGTPNIKNMAEDVYRFRNMDKMFSSVATREKTKTTKNVVAEIKNIDLTRNGAVAASPKKDAGEMVWE